MQTFKSFVQRKKFASYVYIFYNMSLRLLLAEHCPPVITTKQQQGYCCGRILLQEAQNDNIAVIERDMATFLRIVYGPAVHVNPCKRDIALVAAYAYIATVSGRKQCAAPGRALEMRIFVVRSTRAKSACSHQGQAWARWPLDLEFIAIQLGISFLTLSTASGLPPAILLRHSAVCA